MAEAELEMGVMGEERDDLKTWTSMGTWHSVIPNTDTSGVTTPSSSADPRLAMIGGT